MNIKFIKTFITKEPKLFIRNIKKMGFNKALKYEIESIKTFINLGYFKY